MHAARALADAAPPRRLRHLEEAPLQLTDKQKNDLEWDLGWELHKYARQQQRDDFKKLLKEGGAYCGAPDVFPDLNWQNELGSTPMWWTCMNGDAELTQLLIDAGADVDQCDDDLWTPVSVAARYGHDNCLEVLLKAVGDGCEVAQALLALEMPR